MKLVVFGATGGTGREVVMQALNAGHEVTAVARNPAAMPVQHEHLQVLRGDVLAPETLSQAVHGQAVVIFAVGTADRSADQNFFSGHDECFTGNARCKTCSG